MLVVIDWLNELLVKPPRLDKVLSALESAGIEVENIHHSPVYDDKIVVSEIKAIEPHPHADRLSLVQIDNGTANFKVVCGASNLKLGQKVAHAGVGAKLPDGTVIKQASIRGVDSPGMLLSEKELGLGEDHGGIIELDPGLKAGTKLKQAFMGGTVVDIKTAANRPDLNGLEGIAREVAAQLGIQLNLDLNSGIKTRPPQHFINKVPTNVPRYSLAQLRLPAKIPSTPGYIAQRLRLSGVRPINLVVDITNYVMLVTAQPLHGFDGQRLSGKLTIRKAKSNESITTLDGVERKLSSQDLVIADSQKVVGLAGVMGAANSEITPTTKSVLLEAANFEATSIRRSAQRHGLRTEASARLERGLPVYSVLNGLGMAVKMLEKHGGAKLEWVEDELNVWPWVQHIGVKPAYLSELAGFKMDGSQTVKALTKLGFRAEPFDIAKEAKKHLGKPYKWGANFKTDGVSAFDCSYLIDYVYSLLGINVGHTALGQYETGKPVRTNELRPGDVVFYEGLVKQSETKHYFVLNEDKSHSKRVLKKPKRVGHNAIYIGNDRVIMAARYERAGDDWVERDQQGVIEVPLGEFINDPTYLGARRFVEDLSGWVAVTVPAWRPDVKTPQDVLEEVIKITGLDKVAPTLPPFRVKKLQPDDKSVWYNDLRSLLLGLGSSEVMTYPFLNADQAKLFNLDITKHTNIKNPLTHAQTHLTSSLLPGLLNAVRENTRRQPQFSWFSIDRVFGIGKSAVEAEKLAVIIQSDEDSYKGVKNILDNISRVLNMDIEVHPVTGYSYLHPSRQASISVAKRPLGYIGEISPLLSSRLKIRQSLAYLELDITSLYKQTRSNLFEPISKLQPIRRDLTVYLPQSSRWQEVAQAIKTIKGVEVSYLGDYYPPSGQRALTLQLTISPPPAVSIDEHIFTTIAQLEGLLARKFKAKIKA